MTRSKRGKKRPAAGTIDELPSGALRVRVEGGIDPVTKRRFRPTEIIPAGADAKDRANAALIRMLNEVNEQRHPKTNATVNQLLDKHLDLMHVEETTKRNLRRYAKSHIRPLIGEEKVGRIDANILDSLYAELLRCRVHCRNKRFTDHRTPRKHECDTRCQPHTCKPLAAWTVRKIHFLLSGAFERAVRWKWISANPATQADPPPAPTPDPQPPTAEEAARILNQAWKDLDWGTLVWTVMTTSPRRAEICGLRWRHFDADRQLLTYHRNIAQDGTDIWEKDTKTHQRRNITLDPETVAVLSDYRQRYSERAAALRLSITPASFIFSLDPAGKTSLRPASVTQRYNRLAQRLGIKTTLHKLRHYSATELIAAGVDIRTVAGRLGHSGGGTTTLKVYAAWVSEADQRASATLLTRVPERPAPPPTPAERAKANPQAPYEHIAAQLRHEILAGEREDKSLAPSVKQLAEQHGVAEATAHRAIGLLKTWGLAEASRGRRTVIIRPAEPVAEESTPPIGDEPAAVSTGDTLLDLRLLCLGEEVRTFTAKADPSDEGHLHRLLAGAARRHNGEDIDLNDYELEVRQAGEATLLTRFAALDPLRAG
ncbi:MAG: tyrosine-type recombinase/integrase [Pseudonocardiaceae bacterium]|nr:tyrosine-type recombinase/integrase [Pseudonocardiaceae bacterium]